VNRGRVAGLWYLLLVFLGPLRLIYIPNALFVPHDAAATVRNIATHESLFRLGMVADLSGAVVLMKFSGARGSSRWGRLSTVRDSCRVSWESG
jgi:hypothetical protein